jgi:hypothetical protein
MKPLSRTVKFVALFCALGCISVGPYLLWAHMKARVTIGFNESGLCCRYELETQSRCA